jgi:predicted pyridoxine 5'-phosphate oxidase superfamily flavin-nucleotide-binding protein
MTIVTSVDQLNALYGDPGEASLVKVTNFLLPEYRAMIEASPFMALATVGPEGSTARRAAMPVPSSISRMSAR